VSDPISELEGVAFSSSSSYTIIEEIGRGGMGIVFLAEKDAEGVVDEVVLKTIKTLSPEHEEKLKREANIATRLRHENIVKTYGLESIPYGELPEGFRKEIDALDPEQARRAAPRLLQARGDMRRQLRLRRLEAMQRARRDERRLYLMVMDYIEGTDLRTLHQEHLRRRRLLPCPLAAFIVSRMCRALSYAHRTIIHRDVTPENILINQQGVAKLSDFGVAADAASSTTQITGKLGYMSPEQLAGRPIDARSDIYSLGAVLYQTITGVPLQPPPPGQPLMRQLEAVRALAAREPAPPSAVRPDVPEVLSKICMQMIARDPHMRLLRAEDAGDLLEQKYLYAGGFGPTNNSLAAYLRLFEREFKDPTADELRQLAFLKGGDGKLHIQRKLGS
jgi:serine/threonine protein kinase